MPLDYLVNPMPGKLKPQEPLANILGMPQYLVGTGAYAAATNHPRDSIPPHLALYGTLKEPPPYRSNELPKPAAAQMSTREALYRLMYL
ncbi:MAG TPA: hypothetical protein VI934_01755 [Candidatus Nanoarchaeia archaeon]|nr:hypothetical protein [Candidatus Nanoarchaeia archaeon]